MSTLYDRRSFLRSMLYGPTALFSLEAFNAKRCDAQAAIGPKDNIKVTKIETFVLKNSWVFVKLSTDAGVVGWGEMLKDDAKACAAGALEVGNYLIGQDPRRVVHHWQAIHRGSFYKGGPIKTAIQSGIDMALWDITGKCYGVPVYKLLGGPTRDRCRVYGTVSEVTGVNAMKVGHRGSRTPFGCHEGLKMVEEVTERFAALRKKMGSGVDIGTNPLVNNPVRSGNRSASRSSDNTRMEVSSLCTTSPCAAWRWSSSRAVGGGPRLPL